MCDIFIKKIYNLHMLIATKSTFPYFTGFGWMRLAYDTNTQVTPISVHTCTLHVNAHRNIVARLKISQFIQQTKFDIYHMTVTW